MKLTFVLLFIVFLRSVSLTHAQVPDFETDSITSNTLVASSFISDNEGWIADNAGMLWHTTDAAQTWSPSVTEKHFLKLDFADALHGFGITSDASYKTTDGGVTWAVVTLPGEIGNSIYFLNSTTGFITGKGAIYKTIDGGDTWETISTDGVDFADFYFVTSIVGLAAAIDYGGNRTIWKSTDAGSSWSNVYNEENYIFNSIWFTDENKGWAAGYYYTAAGTKQPCINHTIDGGISWENVYINYEPGDVRGEEFIDLHFTGELEGFALSTFSQSVYTIDGGVTWNFTHDESGIEIIPDWGIYRFLDGHSDMYLMGRNGYVTKWK